MAADPVSLSPKLTQAQLKKLLRYDPDTGLFIRLVSRGRCVAGSIAGSSVASGHIAIGIDGISYSAHRLAWFYMTGEWPARDIDHEDTDGSNNRWRNLRLATSSQNAANARLSRRNTSGYKGAHYHKKNGRWVAKIRNGGRLVHLGCFDTPEEAHAAYIAAAKHLFGEFARSA